MCINLVPYYIKIATEYETICAGPHQQFYVLQENKWISAEDLRPRQHLFTPLSQTAVIIHIETVKESTRVYRLTTADHTFCVSPYGFWAHNTDPATAALNMGYVLTLNPVVATIGATVALSTAAALLLYESWNNQEPQQTNNEESLDDFYIHERNYYAKRKKELLTLKQKLVDSKKGLEKIAQLCRNQHLNFSSDFLQPLKFDIPQCLKNNLSVGQEHKLTEQQRQKLTTLREKDLLRIENEIIELQMALSFHFNELIERVHAAFERYEKYSSPISTLISQWSGYRVHITEKLSLQNYESSVKALFLIEKAENCLTELTLATNYYKSHKKDSVIKKTTNVGKIIPTIEKDVARKETLLKQGKEIFGRNKSVEETYLSSRRTIKINELYQNILKAIHAEAEEYETNALNNAHQKYKATQRHAATLSCTEEKDQSPCACNCKGNSVSCGCPQGCPCGKKVRIINTVTKTDFFNCKRIKDNYHHFQKNVYRLKPGGQEIVKNAYYLEWDYDHNEVEVYNKNNKHLGALDPQTMKLYKQAQCNRSPFK
jgi:hypothetical protein